MTKKERHQYYIKYYRANPWKKKLETIKSRCYCKSSPYYKKKLNVSLTENDIKNLWFRDKAWLLEYPSIDRIDDSKGYFFNNCRYIELVKNIQKGLKKQWGEYRAKNRWSMKYDRCIICNSRTYKHRAHGRCRSCDSKYRRKR